MNTDVLFISNVVIGCYNMSIPYCEDQVCISLDLRGVAGICALYQLVCALYCVLDR